MNYDDILSDIEETILDVKFIPSGTGRIKLVTESSIVKNHLSSKFKIKNKKKAFIKNCKLPDFISPFTPLFSFKSGLIYEILNELKSMRNIKIDISEVIDIIRPMKYELAELIKVENSEIEYRDYQELAINKCISIGRGIVRYATGSGKSLIMYGLIKNLCELKKAKLKTLIVVPNVQLCYQLREEFVNNYGCDIKYTAMYTANEDKNRNKKRVVVEESIISEDAHIFFCNSAFLLNRIDEIGYDFDLLIIDECHGLKQSANISNIIMKFPTNIKFGLTATMPENIEDVWCVTGVIGAVLCELDPSELQDMGNAVKTSFVNIMFEHNIPAPRPALEIDDIIERAKAVFQLEVEYIENCTQTNDFISQFCVNLKGNTIVLFDHNVFGNYLYTKTIELVEKHDTQYEVFYVDGDVDVSVREEFRSKMERSSNCILLANTKCFSTGINIKNIDNIVFVFNGKAVTKVLQSIGRGLRMKEGKKVCNIFDFFHNYKYSTKHHSERYMLYKKNYNIEKEVKKVVRVND